MHRPAGPDQVRKSTEAGVGTAFEVSVIADPAATLVWRPAAENLPVPDYGHFGAASSASARLRTVISGAGRLVPLHRRLVERREMGTVDGRAQVAEHHRSRLPGQARPRAEELASRGIASTKS
jgi:hypothetical protein